MFIIILLYIGFILLSLVYRRVSASNTHTHMEPNDGEHGVSSHNLFGLSERHTIC